MVQHGRVFTPGTALPGNPYTINLSKVLLVCSHMCMKKSRTTLPLEEKDREAIAAIREYYGVQSDLDAIRIALREELRRIQATQSTPKQGLASHPAP